MEIVSHFKKEVKLNKDDLSKKISLCIEMFDNEEATKRIVEYIDSTISLCYADCDMQLDAIKMNEVIYLEKG